MPFFAVLIYALMITPVVIKARFDFGKLTTVKMQIMFWRMSFRFDALMERGDSGLVWLVRESKGDDKNTPVFGVRMNTLLSGFIRQKRARRYILGHMRLYELNASARISTGDAAFTALLCGVIDGLLMPLSHYIKNRQGFKPNFDVRTDYSSMRSVLTSNCIIAVLPGDIMAALCMAALKKVKKEARKKWIDIPLKA